MWYLQSRWRVQACTLLCPEPLRWGRRDDNGRVALHWAAELGLTDVVGLLLPAYAVQAAVAAERAAVRAAALTAAGNAAAAAAMLKVRADQPTP